MFNYKSLREKELDYIFQDVSFKISPRWHQFVTLAFIQGEKLERVLLFEGVGTGKTLCSLFTTQFWNCKKILVICPGSAFSAWERDIPGGTDYSYTFLVGSKKERIRELKKGRDVSIINYAGLKSIYCKLIGGKGWKINSSFSDNFDCIIIDEAHRVNNYKSLQTKIIYQLSKRAKYVIGMTGTSVDKSMLELFNIYKTVDLGKSLGFNFFIYRNAYFYPAGYDWKLKDGAKEKILKSISGNTISFDREECFDLPDLQEEMIIVRPSKEFLDLQNQIIRDLPINIKDIDINNFDIKAKANCLRELSGGFLYYNEENERKTYYLKNNPKLDALLELVEATESKILIFYWYKEERILIEKMLKKNKIGFVSVYGGQNHIERNKAIKQFTDNSNVQIMIAQSRISEGYDASIAQIAIFYLPLGSPRMRTQCVGRIYRSGQTKKCIVYDLVLEDSVDHRIIKDRSERFSLVNSVKKYMQSYCQEESSEI